MTRFKVGDRVRLTAMGQRTFLYHPFTQGVVESINANSSLVRIRFLDGWGGIHEWHSSWLEPVDPPRPLLGLTLDWWRGHPLPEAIS